VTRGLERFHQSRQTHFVTFSCYLRLPKLVDAPVCDLFLETLEQMRVQFQLSVYAFVVMPEHVHLLLSEPGVDSLAEALHWLKLTYSKRVRSRVACEGAFWQKRYFDLNVRNHRQFMEKVRYIHRNPVKRGLCASPDQWPWSSFRHYAFLEALPVEIESEWTAQNREAVKLGGRPSVRLIPR